MTSLEIKVWKDRIGRARALQQTQHDDWKKAERIYNCDMQGILPGVDLEQVDVNFGKWYVDNLVPLVYFRDPFIFVKPRHEKYTSFAETMETVINYYWRELYLKQEFQRVILSSFLMPPGWIKLGYTAKIGQDIAKVEEIKQKSIIQQIKDTITGKSQKKEEKNPESLGVLNEYIKEESVFATWIPSWNMLMPEGYQVISRMPYLIEIEDVTKEDFLANPIYKNKEFISSGFPTERQSENTGKLHKPNFNNPEQFGKGVDEEINVITLYHIWDRRNQKRYTISYESEQPHFEGDFDWMEGFPYEPLNFEDNIPSFNKSNPYPTNVFKPILPQLIEVTLARTQMVKWRRRASAIILAQKGLTTEEDMKQITDTEAVQIVRVQNIQAFQMTQSPPLPNGVFDIDGTIKQDLQMGTNMGQMMFGAQPGQRTATQAGIAQSGLQLKSQARIDKVEDFTVRVARKIAQLIWWFYDKEKVAEIIGEDVTDEMWVPRPDDIDERHRIMQAELQFIIDAGSTAAPKDESVDRKQLLDMASIVATVAPERINKGEFAKSLMKKFKFAKDLKKVIISDDDDEKNCAMEENQLLEQNMPAVVSPNQNHVLHMAVHSQMKQHTQSGDAHMMSHGKFMGIEQGDKKPGGNRPPMQASNPRIVRGGATNQGDIAQSTMNRGIGTGPEAK